MKDVALGVEMGVDLQFKIRVQCTKYYWLKLYAHKRH